MKLKYLAAGTALAAIFLSGCGQNDDPANAGADTEEVEIIPIHVELTVPETGSPESPVKLQAEVTQGNEKVTDASEVVYELWEEGKKEASWKVPSDQTSDGVYEAEAAFDHAGQYQVQVHVTARDMHTMPVKEILIGSGAAHHGEGHPSAQGNHHEHHATEGFVMHFEEPEEVKAGEPINMKVHLQQDNKPLADARVRMEIVENDQTDSAQWVKLDEVKDGEYAGTVTFASKGSAAVTVHVEGAHGLHEHEAHRIEIAEQ